VAEHDERNQSPESEARSEAEASAKAVATVPEAEAAENMQPPEAADAEPVADDGNEEEAAYDEEYGEEEHVVVIRRGLFWSLAAAAILIIAALAGLNVYQALRNREPAVAVVNGERIPRSAYDKLIATSGNGQQALNQLINQTLLAQDAARHHVTVSPDELDTELQKQKAGFASDSEYRQALAQAHLTEPELREQLKYQVLLNKLVLDKVTVSDSEIQQEYNQNKDTTYQGKTLDQVKDEIKQDLLQQKQVAAEQAYFDRLHAEAKIKQHLPGD
jgi:hypothetical protein